MSTYTHTMASLLHLYPVLLLFPFIIICTLASKPDIKPYVVYMGSSSNADGGDGDTDSSHLRLLSSVVPSDESHRNKLLHSYNHALKGFSAMLTENEASILSGHDAVISVFPDTVIKLHTTRSWDFLEEVGSKSVRSASPYPYDRKGLSDVIIGVLDTGIWPESPSFNDHNIGKIPSKWKGVCMKGPDFEKSNCNRKLIGARFYSSYEISDETTLPFESGSSPRDYFGHGTHVASIAGGARVSNASYNGLAPGVARGGSPLARIASYKTCTTLFCPGSIVLKAIDDAIKDGVDIISISAGQSSWYLQDDFLKDPIALGAFHAEQMGVAVVCSGGNAGPFPLVVVNSAPWIFTVVASTIDRDFKSTVLLGNNESYEGNAISFSPMRPTEKYPLVLGRDLAEHSYLTHVASECWPNTFDRPKAAGKIVVCMNSYDGARDISIEVQISVVQDAGAKGLIVVHEHGPGGEKALPLFDSGTYPFVQFGGTGFKIVDYIHSTENATATILPTREIRNVKPAPVPASFSPRGPGPFTANILKPDIMAPGVDILGATVPKPASSDEAPDERAPAFAIASGTSMATPQVTGAMAFIKSVHPRWSFSAIKSALMTTATISNNMGEPLSSNTNFSVDPLSVGAGEINPLKALDPGLVFETTITDYLNFLCYYGYNETQVRLMTKTNFTCKRNTSKDRISSINYPTISIGTLNQHVKPKIKVKRVVTNMGSPNATYVSSINAPPGLRVKVLPESITFRQGKRRASFRVLFDGKQASTGYNFGYITWSDGSHIVRLVFAVNVE